MQLNITPARNREMQSALREGMRRCRQMADNPGLANQSALERIDSAYQSYPDGADAITGSAYMDSSDEQYTQALQVIDKANVIDVPFTVIEATETQNAYDLKSAQRMIPPFERRQATRQTVDESIESHQVDDKSLLGSVKRIMFGEACETKEQRQAKQAAAQSERTEIPPETKKVLYSKDTCTSQGQSINYKVTMQKVDWGRAIKENSRSTAESVEHLVSYLTNAIRDCYGGWGRITEIIVRDQQLIINRSCFRPVIDPKTVDVGVFPIDTLDYLREGAIAGFFDWGMLKHMRNLMVLDVDDMGFYEVNIGGRLKCGRRIGVSTLFNLCSSLEILVLGGEAVTRESLNTPEATPVKKKLADHKRFSLFSDGYKIQVCKNTNSFASWTFGNMTAYACNRGNKGLFRYCGGVLTRAGLAGAAGIVNMGAHLVGGIRDIFKEAMSPVNPEDVGLQ